MGFTERDEDASQSDSESSERFSPSDEDDEEEKKPIKSLKPRATSKKTEKKAAAPKAKKESKELRKKARAPIGHLRTLDPKRANEIDYYRKMVKIVYDSMIFDQEAFEAEHKGKRGAKPNWDYLEIALDNLENLWIDHIEFK